MKLYPLSDKVVVKMMQADETTKSGIILTAAKEKPHMAQVIAVGPGGVVDGKKIEMPIKNDDKVIINRYSGSEVKIEDDEYIIVKISDVLAIVK